MAPTAPRRQDADLIRLLDQSRSPARMRRLTATARSQSDIRFHRDRCSCKIARSFFDPPFDLALGLPLAAT